MKIAFQSPQWRYFAYVQALGIAYFWLFVSDTLRKSSADTEVLVVFSFKYLLVTNFFLVLFSLNKWVWRASWALLCVASGLADYFMSNYGVQITRDALTVFFQATPKDVGAFSISSVAIHLIPSLILVLAGWLLIRQRLMLSRFGYIGLAILILVIGGATAAEFKIWYRLDRMIPYNILSASYGYYQYNNELQIAVTSRKNIGEQAGVFIGQSKEPLTIVLVVGESARADHFSLNGYKRQTNPLLPKLKNLVNFSNSTSCGVMTHTSVPCILTRATKSDLSVITEETSIISVYNALNFSTRWFGSQGDFSLSLPVSYISKEAQKRVVLFTPDSGRSPYDGELLPYLEEAITINNNQFIVLHTNGSHISYVSRYPKEFEKFPTICKESVLSFSARVFVLTNPTSAANARYARKKGNAADGCSSSVEMLVNSYDNSILYTDWVLHEIIKRLEHKNAIMLYVSDHGESLGENGKFLHGHKDQRSNWEVPMIAWASDNFISNNSKKWAKFKSHRKDNVSHDNVFHTLLDCSGVDSPLIDKSLSLCR